MIRGICFQRRQSSFICSHLVCNQSSLFCKSCAKPLYPSSTFSLHSPRAQTFTSILHDSFFHFHLSKSFTKFSKKSTLKDNMIFSLKFDLHPLRACDLSYNNTRCVEELIFFQRLFFKDFEFLVFFGISASE